jgi:hypothetical protein
MKRVYALLLIVVVTAGCIAVPFGEPPKQNHSFIAKNTANTTYTFEVFVVELPANITIRRSDGMVDTDPIEVGNYFDPGENRTYTAVEVPDTARLHGRFTLEPGESIRTPIKNHPKRFALVLLAYQGDNEHEIVGYVTAIGCIYNKERTTLKLRVTSHSGEYPLRVTDTCV